MVWFIIIVYLLFNSCRWSVRWVVCVLSEGPSVLGSLLEDPVVLDVAPDTSFSIWVSFCEIYNENIHDLLDAGPPGAPRRAALRLSQDIKGNSFVKGQLCVCVQV